MAENKTKATEASVESYFAAIGDEARRKDCETLTRLMTKVTKQPPKMWGTSIVGFGSYHYKYESGREGDSCLTASPRARTTSACTSRRMCLDKPDFSRNSASTRSARDVCM